MHFPKSKSLKLEHIHEKLRFIPTLAQCLGQGHKYRIHTRWLKHISEKANPITLTKTCFLFWLEDDGTGNIGPRPIALAQLLLFPPLASCYSARLLMCMCLPLSPPLLGQQHSHVLSTLPHIYRFNAILIITPTSCITELEKPILISKKKKKKEAWKPKQS